MTNRRFKLARLPGVLFLFLAGCTTLPPLPPQQEVRSLPPAPAGLIAEMTQQLSAELKDDDSVIMTGPVEVCYTGYLPINN